MKLKRIIQNSGIIFLGLGLGILFIEIGLRLLGIAYPSFGTADAYRGMALRPHAEGWYREEGEAYIQINSVGLRDEEHTKAKPPNTLRIAILGDSYAEARQLPLEQTFWSILEQDLQGCLPEDVEIEVINFGVGGYGTAQELLTLRHYVWDYSPDIVLLAFLTGNDIRNNVRSLNQTNNIPYFVYEGEDLVVDNAFRQSSEYRFRQSSLGRLFEWSVTHLNVVQVMSKNARDLIRQRKDFYKPGALIEIGLDDAIYYPPTEAIWLEAWRVTEDLVRLMHREVEANGAKFFVVTLTNSIQVHPDASLRQAFMDQLEIDTLFYPDERIKKLGDQEKFPVLNLAQLFQSYAEQEQVFIHGFSNTNLEPGRGHWNHLGHRLAGEKIAEALCPVVDDLEIDKGLTSLKGGDQ